MPSLPSFSEGPGSPGSLPTTVRHTLLVGAAVAIVLVAALTGLSLRAALTDRQPAMEATPPEAMLAVAPGGVLDPEDVPPALEGHYQSAERHHDTFEQVPCFCGCEEMLGHRHLGDCFIRADGQGLESHAIGCGVCLGQAQQVADLITFGTTDPDEIRAAVVAEWGDPYQTRG